MRVQKLRWMSEPDILPGLTGQEPSKIRPRYTPVDSLLGYALSEKDGTRSSGPLLSTRFRTAQLASHALLAIRSAALQANAWHHRSDALSSVAVLLGVGGAQINPDWHILDAYAALVVSLFIFKVGLEVLISSAREFTDTAPAPDIMDRVRSCASTVPGVIETHDIRVRMSGGLYQMELHAMVDGTLTVVEGHQIAKKIEACLREEFDELSQVIIHVDPSKE